MYRTLGLGPHDDAPEQGLELGVQDAGTILLMTLTSLSLISGSLERSQTCGQMVRGWPRSRSSR